MYEAIMLSDILVDDDRFREILDDAISKGEVESYPTYAKETDETRLKAKKVAKKSRDDFDKRQAAEEAKAKKVGKSNGKAKSKNSGGDMADLAALIQQRQASRAGGFFDHLEAKYAPKGKGSKRATPMEEPLEEAFQATAARAKRRKQSKKVVEEDDDEDLDLREEDISVSDEEEEEEAPRKSKARTKARGRGRTSSIA